MDVGDGRQVHVYFAAMSYGSVRLKATTIIGHHLTTA